MKRKTKVEVLILMLTIACVVVLYAENRFAAFMRKQHTREPIVDSPVTQPIANQQKETLRRSKDSEFFQLIIDALSDDNPDKLAALIKQKSIDIDVRNENGETPLMIAIRMNKAPDFIVMMLKAGAHVNASSDRGDLPLIEAASYSQRPETIEELLKWGADPKIKNNWGESALARAFDNDDLIATKAYKLLEARSDPQIVKQYREKEYDSFVATCGTSHFYSKIEKGESYYPGYRKIVRMAPKIKDINALDSNGMTPLINASRKNGDMRVVPFLIKAGAGLNVRDKNGHPPLWQAYSLEVVRALLANGARVTEPSGVLAGEAEERGDVNIISLLLEHGADPNQLGEDGSRPLVSAAANERGRAAFDLLLSSGARVDTTDGEGRTALMGAASIKGHTEMVSLLIAEGIDVNAQDKMGNTALMYAANVFRNMETVKLLLQSGANVNTSNRSGITAFHNAVINAHDPDLVHALLDAGAIVKELDSQGHTLLMRAISNPNRHNDIEVLSTLIRKGVNVNARGPGGITALMLASNGFYARTVDLLIKAGADVHARDFNGRTAMMYDVDRWFDHGGPSAGVEILLKAGADTEIKDAWGWKAADLAEKSYRTKPLSKLLQHPVPKMRKQTFFEVCEFGTEEEISRVLSKKNHPNLRDRDDWSAFMLAVRSNENPGVVDFLIKKAANIKDVTYNNWPPLRVAVHFQNVEAVEALIRAGADVHYRDDEGKSILAIALSSFRLFPGSHTRDKDRKERIVTNTRIINELIKAGANVNHVDAQGRSSLFYANTSESVRILVRNGANVNSIDKGTGETPLISKIRRFLDNQEVKVIEALLDSGANVHLKDKKGKKAVDYVIEKRRDMGNPIVDRLEAMSAQRQ